MKSILLTSLALALSLSTFSQVKDIDGNEYKTVKIGEQEWMAENLKVTHFNNGDPIVEAKSDEEWKELAEAKKPAWCYYDYDSSNNEAYGKLYNWYAVSDLRGIAPKNFKVPSENELSNIIDVLYKQDTSWIKVRDFIGKFAGEMNLSFHFDIDYNTNLWSSSEYGDTDYSWSYQLELPKTDEIKTIHYPDGSWSTSIVIKETGMADAASYAVDRGNGFSVRCMKK